MRQIFHFRRIVRQHNTINSWINVESAIISGTICEAMTLRLQQLQLAYITFGFMIYRYKRF